MWTLWLTLAQANPDRVLARIDDGVRVRVYATIEGDGPAVPRWRRRSGPIKAWTFSDGTAEHYERSEDGTLLETVWFNEAGTPVARAEWTEAVATFTVTVPALPPLSTEGWARTSVGGLSMPVPAEAVPPRWDVGAGHVAAGIFEAGNPTEAAYRDVLEAACGCRVVDRHPAWIDGQTGVRFLVHAERPDGPWLGEAWVVPVQDANVAVYAMWPEADPSAQATLRAMVSLSTWESS